MTARSLLLLLAALLLPPAAAVAAPPAPTGLQDNVVFHAHAPLARNDELLQRLRSPLDALRIKQEIPQNSDALHAWPLDPAKQHFALYVPPAPPPPGGYALLVFVPPWDDARVPLQWIPVLDRTHTIFVSAAHSGNDANVLDGREPLALLAEYSVSQRYPVNPAHIYVGGFSGGSRIALRLALAYPDVFRGALLDAGSDPIGTAQVPLPPADLFHRFQRSTRIVFLTGDDDDIRQMQLAQADAAFQHWCVFDSDSLTMLRTGHALAGAQGFDRALRSLVEPWKPDSRRLATCRAKINGELDAQLRRAQAMLDANRIDDARKLLGQINAHYGGLAAARSVALMRLIDRHP
ncbi:MAG: hypothetical protein ACREPU_03555 [Rhodanobacteraceae bacterium]